MREKRQKRLKVKVGRGVSLNQKPERSKQSQFLRKICYEPLRLVSQKARNTLPLLPLVSFSSWASAARRISGRFISRSIRFLNKYSIGGGLPAEVSARRIRAARTARLRRAGFAGGFFIGHDSSKNSLLNSVMCVTQSWICRLRCFW